MTRATGTVMIDTTAAIKQAFNSNDESRDEFKNGSRGGGFWREKLFRLVTCSAATAFATILELTLIAAKGIQKPAISVPHSVARRNFRSMAMQNNNLVSGLSLQPLKQASVIREKIECIISVISRPCSCRDTAYSARER